MLLLNLLLSFNVSMAGDLARPYFNYPSPAHYNFGENQLLQSWGMRISNCGSYEFECQAFSTPLLLQRPDGRLQKAKLFYECDVVKGPSSAGNYECLFKDSRYALFVGKEIYSHCESQENFDKMVCR